MSKTRWINSILEAAAEEIVAMPWERGARRGQSMARRKAESAKARLAGV